MTSLVRLEQEGTYARIKPEGYLGVERFAAFRRAIEGARYDPDPRDPSRRVNLAPLDKVPTILNRLREADFEARVDGDLHKLLLERTAQQWLDLKGAQERIEIIDRELHAATGKSLFSYQKTGSQWLTLKYGALLADDPGTGKLQPVSEPVLTPYGWRRMGDLAVGHEVIGADGRPTKVEAVFPQGVKEQFLVTLEDGRSARCGLEHLWRVRSRVLTQDRRAIIGFRAQVLSLSNLLEAGLTVPPGVSYAGELRWSVPVLDALDHGRSSWSKIASVEKVAPEDSVCIRVAAADHLYVTKDFIVTHNTLTTITAFPANAPVLIVGPAAAKGVWVGEIEKWRPQLNVRMLAGRDSFRWPRAGENLVTNYDILPPHHDATGQMTGRACKGFLPPPPAKPCGGCKDELVFRNGRAMSIRSGHEESCTGKAKPEDPEPCPGCHPMLQAVEPGTVLVADEAQALKNGKSNRTQRFRALSAAVREKGGRVWLVTGTPMENDPTELWSLLQSAGIAGEAFGDFKTFVALFKGTPKTFGREGRRAGYEWGEPSDEVTSRLQRVSLRRKKEDVLPELPDLMWREVVVDIDRKALSACDSFVQREGGIEKLLELLEKDKIRFETMSKLLTILAIAKLHAALDIVKEHEAANDPILVFSMHREPIDILARRKGWASITGSTKGGEDRMRIEKDFQAGKYRGLACTIQAAGVALTLTRANHVLFIDRSFNPKQNEQAAARIHRPGQNRKCIAELLRANHILDRRLQEVVSRKMRLFSASVDAASVADDAPPCANQDFEAQIRKVQEEIACGRTVRRMAESDGDKDTLDRLHRLMFARASDDRIARDLGEAALHIGLSEAQWDLAASVASRGRESLQPSAISHQPSRELNGGRKVSSRATNAVPIVVGKDGMVMDRNGTPHLVECARISSAGHESCDCGSLPKHEASTREGVDMAKVEKLVDRITSLEPEHRVLLFELLGTNADMDKLRALFDEAKALREPEQDALYGVLDERFCPDGGEDLPCTCEEGDDEDEDDAGDDGGPDDGEDEEDDADGEHDNT